VIRGEKISVFSIGFNQSIIPSTLSCLLARISWAAAGRGLTEGKEWPISTDTPRGPRKNEVFWLAEGAGLLAGLLACWSVWIGWMVWTATPPCHY